VNIRGFGQGRLPALVSDGQPDEIGQLSAAFHDMAVQVEARNTENLTLSESLQRQSTQRGELLKRLITIQEDERKRVARELHDELGQALGGLNFRVEAIQRMVDSDAGRAAKELALTRRLIEEATDQMHNLIYALRPSILDDLGLSAALRSHAERLLECRGIAFDFDSSGLDGRLPSEIETALYRIFQEALNNIVRHSGATQVTLSLSSRDGTLEAEIIDNGDGFDPQAIRGLDQEHGWGLFGMQERVALVGGHLDVHSRSGSGTRIHLSIPL
jgi:signal transduction histidine kinase